MKENQQEQLFVELTNGEGACVSGGATLTLTQLEVLEPGFNRDDPAIMATVYTEVICYLLFGF